MQQNKKSVWKDGTPKSTANAFDWKNWELQAFDNKFMMRIFAAQWASANAKKNIAPKPKR